MSLIELIAEGRAGIGLRLPESLEVLADRETFACWNVPELRVRVIATHSQDPLDLSEARATSLRADVEAGARRIFAQTRRTLEPEAEVEPMWPSRAPLVELEVLARDDGRILRCIHRVAQQPGREIVRGLLLIPTAYGHISLSALHDGRPEHGLTRVRACLAHWLDPELGQLTIAPEPIAFPAGELRVEFASGCSIVRPVGFLPAFPEASAKPAGISTLVRVGIDAAPEAKLSVSQVRYDDEALGEADDLLALARRSLQEWTNRGASDIEIATEVVSDTRHRAEVCVYASLRMDGETHINVARWFVGQDDAIFRIEVWSRSPHRFPDWAPIVEDAARSWQRAWSGG
jgi:hypothetical protein